MTRTARLKEHEGRTLPDLTAPKQEAASNGPDRDEFLFSIGHQKKLQQTIDDAKLMMKKFRNSLKLRGFNLKMMDLAIEEADREDGTTISNMRDLKRYYEFMNLPIGHQFALFDTPQAANANASTDADLMAKAFAEGRERGVKGEFPDEQKWLPVSPEGQEHQRGWNEGQAVHLAKFKSLNEAMAEADKLATAKAARKAAKDAKAAAEAQEPDDEDEGEDIGPADDEEPAAPVAKRTAGRRSGRAAAH